MKFFKSIITLFLLLPIVSLSQDYWEHVYTTDTNSIISLKVANDGTIYYGGEKGLFISHDDGQTWDFKYLFNYIWVNSLEFDLDSNLLVGASYYLYKYDIENDTFHFIETPQPPPISFATILVDSTGIYTNSDHDKMLRYKNGEWSFLDLGDDAGSVYTIVKDTNGVLYAGTTGFDYGGGVFRSFDDGDTWEYFGLHNYYVMSLAIDSYNRLYAGAIGHITTSEGGFFRYNYETLSWDTLSHSARVKSLYFNEEDSLYAGIYSIGGNAGAWMSPDYGDTWYNISSGLPDPSNSSNNVDKLTEGPGSKLWAVIGNQKSIYRSFDSTITFINNLEGSLDREIRIFPNPARNKLNLELKGYEFESILITDLSGRPIKKMIPLIGENGVEINISDLSPSIYLIHCKSDQNISTVKFIKY